MELKNRDKIYKLLEKQGNYEEEYNKLSNTPPEAIRNLRVMIEGRLKYIYLNYLPVEVRQQIKDDILGRIGLQIESIDEQLKEL